jgi:hypothetical protein
LLDGILVQTGKRMGERPTPTLLRAVDQLRSRFGEPIAIGRPRIAGIAEALYLRTGQDCALFDITDPDEPQEVLQFDGPAWLEGTALGGRLLASWNPLTSIVDIYRASVTLMI